MDFSYKHRIADEILDGKLASKGAVLIEGLKWCGKTTTARMHAKSVLLMDGERQNNIALADFAPSALLDGETPRLIDEWQLAPKLWDAVRLEVDKRQKMGQFILTGSTTPYSREGIHHSGTGRFTRLLMRTMSLFESLDSNGSVSLKGLFESPSQIRGKAAIDIKKLSYLVCRGGWPMAVSLNERDSLKQAFDYVDALIEWDLKRLGGIFSNAQRARKIMRCYARQQGTQVSDNKLLDDITSGASGAFSIKALGTFFAALNDMFVIEEMPAWSPNLRSKTAIREANTRYFSDPSIATASLGLGPGDLLSDLNTFGFLFEALAIRDLRIYAEALDGSVYHYRDKSGLECDAVIHLRNGKYGLVEIKLGGDRLIEEGVRNLKRLSSTIDYEKMGAPSFLAVITGVGDYAYMNGDGVCIVPIGALRD